MKYVLCKASIAPNRAYVTLWYANPDCILEKPHKLVVFNTYQIDYIMKQIDDGMIPMVDTNDLPIDIMPEDVKTIHAEWVEVEIGLHKHVSRKINGRPVYTRCVYVFIPLVRCDCSGNFYRRLFDARQLAQEHINRYWIPVDED